MKIRICRKEDEDAVDLDEYMAEAITEDLAKWLEGFWLGHPVGFETKADIYNVVLGRLQKVIKI